MPEFVPDVPEVREDFADYLGEILAVDAGAGVILDELEKAGELDNTLVVMSGDHGIPGLPRAKCNLYDFGSQVALAARWPGKIKPGKVVNELVNLMSWGPTFLEAAGENPTDNMVDRIIYISVILNLIDIQLENYLDWNLKIQIPKIWMIY